MTFFGIMREEDLDWVVDPEWSACRGADPPASNGSKRTLPDSRISSGRCFRIDMAAAINDNICPQKRPGVEKSIEIDETGVFEPEESSMTFTHVESILVSDDEESEKGQTRCCACCFGMCSQNCTRRKCLVLLLFYLLLLAAAVATGVALSRKAKKNRESSTAALNQNQNSQGEPMNDIGDLDESGTDELGSDLSDLVSEPTTPPQQETTPPQPETTVPAVPDPTVPPVPPPTDPPVPPPTDLPVTGPEVDFGVADEGFDFQYDATLSPGDGNNVGGTNVGGANLDATNESFQRLNSDFLVGVYYYPWHGSDFHSGGPYLRKELSPQHVPVLGEYDDSDPAVITQHLKWSQQANIGLWVTSWWGPDRLEDSNTLKIFENSYLGDMKIALHYETIGRIKNGLGTVLTDFEYICENYFNKENYYKVNGRPVVFVYVARKFEAEGSLEELVLTMRSTANKCGHNVFLVGDHVFGDAPDEGTEMKSLWYFDAVTNYDVYGASGVQNQGSKFAGSESVDAYYEDQAQWRDLAFQNNCHYIPAVSPGYNDRAVRLDADHPALSRRLSYYNIEGSLFWYQLKKAKPLVDSTMDNMIMVNSFNEWHEDTMIEPVQGTTSSTPDYLTQGVQYEGYGTLYLDLLRWGTTGEVNEFDNIFHD